MGSKLHQGIPELDVITLEMGQEIEGGAVSRQLSEIPLFPKRHGFAEEAYFNLTYIPLRDLDGKIVGLYNSTVEVTSQKIGQRRAAMFNYMAHPSAVNSGTLAGHVMPQLEINPLDITMALLYEADEISVPGTTQLVLRGSIGFPVGHNLLVEGAPLNDSKGIIPLFREARKQIVTRPVDERFEGVQWRGFGKSTNFSILAISGPGRIFGFLVIGLNPRRPIDGDHQQFMWDLASKISSVAASITNANESRKRAQRLKRDLEHSVTQVKHLATHASVGIAHRSPEGGLMWANEQYYEIVGRSRGELDYPLSFLDLVVDEERQKALASWNRTVNEGSNDSVELHLKNTFTTPAGDSQPKCILMLKFPQIEDGVIKFVMAYLTDVSQTKWAESREAQNAAEAEKVAEAQAAQRRQEEFIDIVSHEMRNPLSAIFQCADMIRLSVEDIKEKGFSKEAVEEVLQSNVDNSAVIILCAQHQKRIVDDVLTLSKLEHMMLLISPHPTEPSVVVEGTMKMFEADLQAHEIKIAVHAEAGLRENSVDWVMCDASRVSQVFINLLTNAMKFTQGEDKREITVRYGARLSEPRKGFQENMIWAPSQAEAEDLTLEPEWGDGEVIYLLFSVSDTGVGMTAEDITKLFNRFNQVTSRTSVKYGGSGLGLFISQKLTERQGGEIGVSSVPEKGTTFAFYVKTGRTEPAAPSSRPTSSLSTTDTTKVQEPDNIHVLLVEDNLVNQKILCKQLSDAGFQVTASDNGAEALKYVTGSDIWYKPVNKSKRLDIILMDWEMPVMDGETATREIRSLQAEGKITKHIKIIATTAHARDEQVQSVLRSGIVSLQYSNAFYGGLLTSN